jgi:hypothetical protein
VAIGATFLLPGIVAVAGAAAATGTGAVTFGLATAGGVKGSTAGLVGVIVLGTALACTTLPPPRLRFKPSPCAAACAACESGGCVSGAGDALCAAFVGGAGCRTAPGTGMGVLLPDPTAAVGGAAGPPMSMPKRDCSAGPCARGAGRLCGCC